MTAGPSVRAAVAAGSFYPGAAAALADRIGALLADARRSGAGVAGAARPLRGIVVPHAGYAYSGPIAASAYALVAVTSPRPGYVVVLGPSHREPLQGWAVPSHAAWATPLGDVVIAEPARRLALERGALVDDAPHRWEHSIEVHLPFLQRVCPGVPALPVAVGACHPRVVAASLSGIVSESVLLVISTDLSHHHDAVTARRLDERTALAIEALDDTRLRPEDACGYWPLRVGIAWARMVGVTIGRLDLRSSAETAGDPDRVVGYGAFAMRSTGPVRTRPSGPGPP